MGARKKISLQNGRALCINQLFPAPPHFVWSYILPGCLISIFFWIWILLACFDPEPQKRRHFVGTCCSAISLRFSQLSLRSNPSFLWGNGLNDMCVSCLFTMLTKSEAFIPLLLLPKSWVVLERQADADKWHGVVFWIPYKMTIKINRGIPYKMDGPNPAKFSNCILSEIAIW